MAESQKIERELFGRASDFLDEEIQYEVRIEANARKILAVEFPYFRRQLLLTNLRRQTHIEMEIGQAINKAIETLNLSQQNYGGSTCTREEICRCLKKAGYNSTICKSKWRDSSEILGGEHTYIQVTTESTGGSKKKKKKKKRDLRAIVELNFRDEFVIVGPTEEYRNLVSLLPNIFVGKTQKLRNLVKIMCSALKLCMEEKNMHMGPWRKENYMQAKWQGKPEDSDQQDRLKILPVDLEKRKRRAMVSLLTLKLSKT